MQFDPLEKQVTGRALFVTDVRKNGSLTVSDLAGATMQVPARAIDRLRGMPGVFYSLVDPSDLIFAGGDPTQWKVHKYHRRKMKMTYGTGRDPGIAVFPMAQFTNDPTALAPFFHELEDLGVALGSLSGMAKNTWRRFLKTPVTISCPRDAVQSVSNAFTGGRRETIGNRAVFNGLAYMDLPAAYLRTMQESLPTRLVRAEPKMYDSGIAEASVFVPDSPGWKPLAITKRQQNIVLSNFATGWLGGTFTFEELRLAREYGCDIEIHDAWAGTDRLDLFGLWLRWAYDLRSMDGTVARGIAKQFTTRLWALFGLNENSKRTIIEFDSDGSLKPSKKLPRIPGVRDTKFIAAIIAARTRVALYSGLTCGAVWADTDGVIVPYEKAHHLERRGWKRKEEISDLQIEDWAHTRYHCIKQTPRGITDLCSICSPPRWHYRIDGVQPDSDDARVAWGLYVPGEHWETDSQGITLESISSERFRNSRTSILPYDKIPIQRGI